MADVPGNVTTKTVLEMTTDGSAGTYSGQLGTEGDHDWIRVTLMENITYNIFLAVQEVGFSNGDSFLSLRDANGVEVAFNENTSLSANSFLSFTPTAGGTFYIDVSDSDSERGEYSVLLTNFNATNVFLSDASEIHNANANERIAGAAGDDLIALDTSGLDALGEQGDDTLIGNPSANLLSGGLGNDFLSGFGGIDFIFGDAGDDFLDGGNDDDQLFGGDGLDDLFGRAGNDHMSGGGGDDALDGAADSDILNGGLGSDLLIGGIDADTFDFNSIKDSVKGGSRDQILDFSHAEGDKIDLSTIDANMHLHSDQAFHFIGSHGFDHHGGELRYANHILQGDVNGDGRADFEISVNAASLHSGDFVL